MGMLADRLTRLDEASREAILQYAEFLLTRQDAAKDPGERQEAKTRKASAIWPMLENGGEGSRTPLATFGIMPYLKGFYGLYCNRITHFLTHHASRASHVLLPITPS